MIYTAVTTETAILNVGPCIRYILDVQYNTAARVQFVFGGSHTMKIASETGEKDGFIFGVITVVNTLFFFFRSIGPHRGTYRFDINKYVYIYNTRWAQTAWFIPHLRRRYQYNNCMLG